MRLYSSTRRNFTHCARRSLLNPRTGPGTRCDNGQKGQTNRVPCAFGIFSTITAQPDRHNFTSTCGAGCSFEPIRPTGLATGLPAAVRAGPTVDLTPGRVAGFTAALASGFTACFVARFPARRELDFRDGRREIRRDVRVALISVLSRTRRAGLTAARSCWVQGKMGSVHFSLPCSGKMN